MKISTMMYIVHTIMRNVHECVYYVISDVKLFVFCQYPITENTSFESTHMMHRYTAHHMYIIYGEDNVVTSYILTYLEVIVVESTTSLSSLTYSFDLLIFLFIKHNYFISSSRHCTDDHPISSNLSSILSSVRLRRMVVVTPKF